MSCWASDSKGRGCVKGLREEQCEKLGHGKGMAVVAGGVKQVGTGGSGADRALLGALLHVMGWVVVWVVWGCKGLQL